MSCTCSLCNLRMLWSSPSLSAISPSFLSPSPPTRPLLLPLPSNFPFFYLLSSLFASLSPPPPFFLPSHLTCLFLSPSSSPSFLTLFSQVASPVTALIHFMTSINAAQVVVAGNKNGVVSWYISQPPQKTFSLLFNAQNHAPHPVIALQVRETRVLDTRNGHSLVYVTRRTQSCAHTIIFEACETPKVGLYLNATTDL